MEKHVSIPIIAWTSDTQSSSDNELISEVRHCITALMLSREKHTLGDQCLSLTIINISILIRSWINMSSFPHCVGGTITLKDTEQSIKTVCVSGCVVISYSFSYIPIVFVL